MASYDGRSCDEKLSNYQTVSILGHCFDSKAMVYLAKHIPSGSMVAIKKFDMDKIKKGIDLVESEIILTRQLCHPHIINYFAAFVAGQEVCVATPLMGYGSCRDLLVRHFNEGLPEPAIITIIRDVLDALVYIHDKGYIHRAIRASHILVSADGYACLAGMRYACPIVANGKWQRSIHSFPATTEKNLNWLSPELLEQNLQGYNEKSDIYSIGIVLCELANGTEPFSGMSKTLMLTEKVRGWKPQLLDRTTVSKEENLDSGGDCEMSTNVLNRRFSDDLHELTGQCLNRDMYDRPSASQLLAHPIFKTIKKSLPLPELLKPALPLNDRVGYDTEEMKNFDMINQMTELDLNSCEWDF
ncbi:ste20-like kinase [Leptinotarsa decemlineata]|uniref:STRAD n=1 Tax=Leptinotarsa decemlineata TaxID=7539 RepID=A0A0M3TCE1_LEPDE|nr:STE20-related kinase adapter protein alpha [Leptinotarsa decemlineata]ALE20573.1 STRAD [Leptinotarsa decemlineata]